MNGTPVMTALACLAWPAPTTRCGWRPGSPFLVSVATGQRLPLRRAVVCRRRTPACRASRPVEDPVAGELPRHSDRLQDRYCCAAPPRHRVVADSLPLVAPAHRKMSSTAPTTTR